MASNVLPPEQTSYTFRTPIQSTHDRALLAKLMLRGHYLADAKEMVIEQARRNGYTVTDAMASGDFRVIRREMKKAVKENADELRGAILARINMERREIWAEIERIRAAGDDVADTETERRDILVDVTGADGKHEKKPVAGHVRIVSKRRYRSLAPLFERLNDLTKTEMDLLNLRGAGAAAEEEQPGEVAKKVAAPPPIDYAEVNRLTKLWAIGELPVAEIIEADVVSVASRG